MLGFAPHITVTSFIGDPLDRADSVLTFLDRFDEIKAKQIVVEGQVMIQTKDGITGTLLKGVNETGDVSGLSEYVVEGSFDLTTPDDGFPGLVIGKKLAQQLQADIGSVITVYTVNGVGAFGVYVSNFESKQIVPILTGTFSKIKPNNERFKTCSETQIQTTPN